MRAAALLRADQHVQLKVREALNREFKAEQDDPGSPTHTVRDRRKDLGLLDEAYGSPIGARGPGETSPDTLEQICRYRVRSPHTVPSALSLTTPRRRRLRPC
jgi:hypothetical protein